MNIFAESLGEVKKFFHVCNVTMTNILVFSF